MKPLLVAAAIVAFAVGGCSDQSVPTTIDIGIRYSRFDTEAITARVGVPLTIALRNDDPIEHEWIVGTALTHEGHRTGTEPHHDTVPTEVTIPAYASKVTTVTFDAPGEYQYICHLPGHEAYGMRGTVQVR